MPHFLLLLLLLRFWASNLRVWNLEPPSATEIGYSKYEPSFSGFFVSLCTTIRLLEISIHSHPPPPLPSTPREGSFSCGAYHAMRGYVSALHIYPCIYERMTTVPRYLFPGSLYLRGSENDDKPYVSPCVYTFSSPPGPTTPTMNTFFDSRNVHFLEKENNLGPFCFSLTWP